MLERNFFVFDLQPKKKAEDTVKIKIEPREPEELPKISGKRKRKEEKDDREDDSKQLEDSEQTTEPGTLTLLGDMTVAMDGSKPDKKKKKKIMTDDKILAQEQEKVSNDEELMNC